MRAHAARLIRRLIERARDIAPPPPPPAFRAVSLIDRNAADPGLQTRISAKAVEVAVNFQKRLLRGVARIFRVPQSVEGESINQRLVLIDQLLESALLASPEPRNQ